MLDNLQSRVKLLDGNSMPFFGLGTFRAANGAQVENAVRYALDYGYRLIDTAAMYENEEGVGKGVRASGIPREQIFVTTKLWPTNFDHVEACFDESLRLLNMDYVDMYMLHWPGTDETARLFAWDKMCELKEKGKIRTLGVSNFYEHHLQSLFDKTGVYPSVDQLEFHPWQQQVENHQYCKKNGIVVQAWGPLFHGHLQEEPLMAQIGEKYGKSAAQVTLRWDIQRDISTIPKSVNEERIAANADIFDFTLSEEDMKTINDLSGKGSFAYNADTFNGVTGK